MLYPTNVDGTLGEEVGVNFYLEDKVYSGWALLGRATTVVGASGDGNDNGGGTEGECNEAQPVQAEIEEDTGDVKGEIRPGGTGTTKHDPAVAKKMHAFNQACDAYLEAYNNIIKSHNLALKVSWPEAS